MRDGIRIYKVIALIERIWLYQPDTRFFQLVENLSREYSRLNDDAGKKTLYIKEEHSFGTVYGGREIVDLYHLEDDDFLEFLQMKHDELYKSQK